MHARIHLKGSGDNDDYFFKRFCVQERTGHQAWHNLRCARGGDVSGGSVTMDVKAARRGIYEFRGVLFEDWHKRLQPSAASDVYRVMVR
ncbi:hypothetical protein ACFOSC_07410 [Streptantibioticus rubrisoli]|uniref:Uncharacterized protein n=1 Tax=Streptantibioticus rubrisoli TaxID=1387313 RepID=A0ABT1PAB9_9ACTN|nr:hypothetical protein [Streptantibioticus rubrisoli]MCQ4041188.1 hypothetical protein [Streptantibioticus rubrisoli]